MVEENKEVNGDLNPAEYSTGKLKELEFQVSRVLNRLENAVVNPNSSNNITIRDINSPLSLKKKTSDEVLDIIQGIFVNVNINNDVEISVPKIPQGVELLSLVCDCLAQYIANTASNVKFTKFIHDETTRYISQIFSFSDYAASYNDKVYDGVQHVFRLLLKERYVNFEENGYESIKQNEPLIYYDSVNSLEIAKYICKNNCLPLRNVRSIYKNIENDDNEGKINPLIIRQMLDEDRTNFKVPLILIADIDSRLMRNDHNIKLLQQICKEFHIWFHLIGDTLAALTCTEDKMDRLFGSLIDSLTINIGYWLNIPSLPIVTLYKVVGEGFMIIKTEGVSSLSIWSTIQCLGSEEITSSIKGKFEMCEKLWYKLSTLNCVKLLSGGPHKKDENESNDEDVLRSFINCVLFKFYPNNNALWTSTYINKLNIWLCEVLKREFPTFPFTTMDIDEDSILISYNPFRCATLQSDEEWESFSISLDQHLEILSATVGQKEMLQNLLKNSECLKLIELPDWAGLGGVRYVPPSWDRLVNDPMTNNQINKLNLQIVQQLRNTDAAFSVGEGSDGLSCIRFGMVGWDSDINDLISLVESVGKQEEDSWNFIDTMAEVVRRGIETATLDLQKENEEKLWQEGILRHVPVFGNIVNWWSPVDKGNTVKGRSLNLAAGVIESTENIYKYHAQGGPDNIEALPAIQKHLANNVHADVEESTEVDGESAILENNIS